MQHGYRALLASPLSRFVTLRSATLSRVVVVKLGSQRLPAAGRSLSEDLLLPEILRIPL